MSARNHCWFPLNYHKVRVLVESWELVRLVLRVPAAGNHPYDGALQRGSPQQPLADQVHVPRGVHAEAAGGAREEDPFVGQQQRQSARDANSTIGRHRRQVRDSRSQVWHPCARATTLFPVNTNINLALPPKPFQNTFLRLRTD